MKKWEYNTLVLNEDIDNTSLDEYGKNGWEIVVITKTDYGTCTIIFKREL